MPLAGADLFRPQATQLLPDLLVALRSQAGLIPATYRILAAMFREADKAGLFSASPAMWADGEDEGPTGSNKGASKNGDKVTSPPPVSTKAATPLLCVAEAAAEADLSLRQSCWRACHEFLQDMLMSCRRYRVRPAEINHTLQ